MIQKSTNKLKIEKTPLSKGKESNRLYGLSFSRSGGVKVVPTLDAIAFLLNFIAFAALMFFYAWNQENGRPSIILNLAGLFFASIPPLLLLLRRPSFKLDYGDIFCRGERIRLEEVQALQVVRMAFYSKEHVYDCWEANIVLQDLSRRHIYVSGNKRAFDAEIQRLAEKLNLPVLENDDTWKPDDEATLRRYEKAKDSVTLRLCFGLLTLVVPLCLMFFGAIFPTYLALRSRIWQKCPAVVTGSEVKQEWQSSGRGGGHWAYKVNIHAKYSYDEKNYLCERYDYFLSRQSSSLPRRKELEKIVQAQPVGKEITCLVNPNSPREAVITSHIPPIAVAQPILWSMPFLMMSIALFIGFFRTILLRRKTIR